MAAIFFMLYSQGYYTNMTVALVFALVFYHFFMRIVVVAIVIASTRNQMTGSSKWFKQCKLEKKLCKAIRISKWKRFIPTFFPEDYSVVDNSLDYIIHSMCLYEVSHEIMLFLTFPPFICAFFMENYNWWAFGITAFIGGMLDIICILIQRHNRPRVMRVKALKEKLNKAK